MDSASVPYLREPILPVDLSPLLVSQKTVMYVRSEANPALHPPNLPGLTN